MAAPTVTTKILIVSDTHCARLDFKPAAPPVDLLIHCGDLTMIGTTAQFLDAVKMLQVINATVKLVIAGNHDRDFDQEYVMRHLECDNISPHHGQQRWQTARNLWTSPQARKEGIFFLDEGFHRIRLANGATVNVFASPYTPEYYDWAFAYERNEDRFNEPQVSLSDAKNIAQHPLQLFSSSSDSNVDIMITHGPSWARLDRTYHDDYAGCPHLLRGVMAARPLIHCFGHIHEGWGAERITWSDSADAVVKSPLSISEWTEAGGWRAGIANRGEAIQTIDESTDANSDEAVQESQTYTEYTNANTGEAFQKSQASTAHVDTKKAMFIDVSLASGAPLQRGRETLLVNAAIMNVDYEPVNPPWVIKIDLPRSKEDE